jgi:tetratricopeptide (TPR) repeat protein
MRKNQLGKAGSLLLIIFFVASCAGDSHLRMAKAKALRELGEAYLNEANYTYALRELLKAEKLSPNDHILQNDLGIAYRKKGKVDLSIIHFKKALKIKPDYSPARNNLGSSYYDKKDWNRAIECFEEVAGDFLYLTPHYPLYNLGRCYYAKKAYRLSEKYYLAALDEEPKFANAFSGLGQTYIAMKRFPEAVTALESALKIAPEFAGAYFYLGRAYRLSHKHKKAYSAYRKVISLVPEHPLAVEAEKEIKKIKNKRPVLLRQKK